MKVAAAASHDSIILIPADANSVIKKKRSHVVVVTPTLIFLTVMTFAFMAASTKGCHVGPELIARLSTVTFDATEAHLWGARYLPSDFESVARWLTNVFVHASFNHMIVNAIFLMICGVAYERAVGPFRSAIVFLLSALGGSFMAAAFESPCLTYLGISGVCFGFAAAVVMHSVQAAMWDKGLLFPRTLPNMSWWLVVSLELFMIFGAFIEPVILKKKEVSHMTHFGGFLTGQAVAIALGTWPPKWRPLCYSIAVVEVLIVFVAAPALVYTTVMEDARAC